MDAADPENSWYWHRGSSMQGLVGISSKQTAQDGLCHVSGRGIRYPTASLARSTLKCIVGFPCIDPTREPQHGSGDRDIATPALIAQENRLSG
jgi:hypothetical protein